MSYQKRSNFPGFIHASGRIITIIIILVGNFTGEITLEYRNKMSQNSFLLLIICYFTISHYSQQEYSIVIIRSLI